jgi:Fimbrial assembly protein (PilN)
MKRGIHLGPPLARRAFASTFGLVVLGAIAVALGILTYRAQREVAALRLEVPGGESGTSARTTEPVSGSTSGAWSREAELRLRSVLQSGLLGATSPTDALGAVASALPDGVVLASLSLSANPPNRSLLLEALADDAGKVTDLERRMARSPMVDATRLLEERRAAGGRLLVRLQVDLAEPSR